MMDEMLIVIYKVWFFNPCGLEHWVKGMRNSNVAPDYCKRAASFIEQYLNEDTYERA
jgi:hypothetical protein